MFELSIEQRQQLTDYQLGLLEAAEAAQVEELLARSQAARDFLGRVEQTLAPLKALPEPQAPDSLVVLTMARVRSAAALQDQQTAGNGRFAGSRRSSAAGRPWQLRFPDLVTIAASIALLVGFLVPAVRTWHNAALRQSCAYQQAAIGSALRTYSQANDNQLAYIPAKQGTTWMYSSPAGSKRTDTSNLFLLVKLGYAQPKIFICPGVPHRPEDLNYQPSQLADFPSESVVSYSYQNMFGQHRPTLDSPPGVAVLADRNPLLLLGPRPTVVTKYLYLTSPNHGTDRGQNVLRLDYSVIWSTTPQAGFKGDDIWRPADITAPNAPLQGQEVPVSSQDSFLGP